MKKPPRRGRLETHDQQSATNFLRAAPITDNNPVPSRRNVPGSGVVVKDPLFGSYQSQIDEYVNDNLSVPGLVVKVNEGGQSFAFVQTSSINPVIGEIEAGSVTLKFCCPLVGKVKEPVLNVTAKSTSSTFPR